MVIVEMHCVYQGMRTALHWNYIVILFGTTLSPVHDNNLPFVCRDMDLSWQGMSAMLSASPGDRRDPLLEVSDSGGGDPMAEEEEGLITSEPLSYGSNKRSY